MSCELFDTFHPIIVTPGWVCFGCALCAPCSGSLSGATHCTLRKEPNSTDDICLFLINILTSWWVHIAHILKHTVTLFMEAHSSLCLLRIWRRLKWTGVFSPPWKVLKFHLGATLLWPSDPDVRLILCCQSNFFSSFRSLQWLNSRMKKRKMLLPFVFHSTDLFLH